MLDLRNKFIKNIILVYGFGKTGKACFNYLKKNNDVLIFDDNKKKIPLKYKQFIFKKNTQKKFDYIVLSPGINIKKCGLKTFLKRNNNKIITDLDIFYFKNINNLKITITGTNGKSTTAKLLHEVLKNHKRDVRLIGNIGKPVLLEKRITKNTEFVIEASSYQLAYSKYFRSDHAMILNISPDHIERHGNISNYVNAKLKLIYLQDNKCFSYIDRKNKYLKKKLNKKKIRSKIINVDLDIYKRLEKKIYNQYFTNINNMNNLAFIIEYAKKNKLNQKKIIDTVNSFTGLKYRQETIFERKEARIINDSKSTSFSSSLNLLKKYKKIYWLIGGIPKKGDKFNLEKKYFKNIDAYIYGKKKNFFIKSFKNKISFQTFSSLEQALQKIYKDVKRNKIINPTILFSPAAASFDRFKNFEHRGKFFNNLIKKINFTRKICEK